MPVKPYHMLTRSGRFRRMRPIILKALDQYDLDVDKISALQDFTNMIFKIETTSGRKYTARICTPDWRTSTDLYSEVDWLLALKDEPDIHAPVPLLTKDGQYFVSVPVADDFHLRVVVLSWLPGTLLLHRLTKKNLFKMGELFARLHIQSSGLVPSSGFTSRQMSRVLARDEVDALLDLKIQKSLTHSQIELLNSIKSSVQKCYSKRYNGSEKPRVIHHDLHHENILVYKGILQPFDFEDTVWGYPVQDLAMALLDLLDEVGPEKYRVLSNSFKEGYQSHLPWPEQYPGELRTFQLGRRLWVANSTARFDPDELPDLITPQWFDTIPLVK